MPMRRVTIGQRVGPAMAQRAKELRCRMTAEENLLWQRLRTNRLQGLHFRRQQVIAGYIVDFYCHAAGLVVEVDGEVHQQQQEYDQERDTLLAARGLRILRVSNEEILADLGGVLEHIAQACREQT